MLNTSGRALKLTMHWSSTTTEVPKQRRRPCKYSCIAQRRRFRASDTALHPPPISSPRPIELTLPYRCHTHVWLCDRCLSSLHATQQIHGTVGVPHPLQLCRATSPSALTWRASAGRAHWLRDAPSPQAEPCEERPTERVSRVAVAPRPWSPRAQAAASARNGTEQCMHTTHARRHVLRCVSSKGHEARSDAFGSIRSGKIRARVVSTRALCDGLVRQHY